MGVAGWSHMASLQYSTGLLLTMREIPLGQNSMALVKGVPAATSDPVPHRSDAHATVRQRHRKARATSGTQQQQLRSGGQLQESPRPSTASARAACRRANTQPPPHVPMHASGDRGTPESTAVVITIVLQDADYPVRKLARHAFAISICNRQTHMHFGVHLNLGSRRRRLPCGLLGPSASLRVVPSQYVCGSGECMCT